MFAVIRTGGKQYRVQEGDILDVEKLDLEEGQKVTFDQVLLIGDEKTALIGTPVVEKACVYAKVIENFKDKKVIIFKKKRRKQYRKKMGHRQELTRVQIEKILSDRQAEKPRPPSAKKPPHPARKAAAPVKPASAEKPKKAEKKAATRPKPSKTEPVEASPASRAKPKKTSASQPKAGSLQKKKKEAKEKENGS